MDYFKVFFIHDPDPNPAFWHFEIANHFPDGSGVDKWAYTRCQQLDDPKPVPFAIKSLGDRADFNYSVFCGVVASERLAQIFTDFGGDDVQLIPAVLPGSDKWFVVNALACVDAIDWKRSVIQYHDMGDKERPGKPKGVARLVIDPRRTKNKHIFRLHDWPVVLIVSSEFKTRCEMEGMSNMAFTCVTPPMSQDVKLGLAPRSN